MSCCQIYHIMKLVKDDKTTIDDRRLNPVQLANFVAAVSKKDHLVGLKNPPLIHGASFGTIQPPFIRIWAEAGEGLDQPGDEFLDLEEIWGNIQAVACGKGACQQEEADGPCLL